MNAEATTAGAGRSPGAAIRFVGALAGFLLLSAGAPWALTAVSRWRFGGWSPFHGVPSPDDWTWSGVRMALTDRLAESTVADVVIRAGLVVGWIAVVVIVCSVVAEVVHLVRFDGIGVPDIRFLGPSQRLGRVIAAGLLVVVPVVGSGRTLAVGSVPLTPQPVTAAVATSVVTSVVEHRDPAADEGDRSAPGETRRHVVAAGDSVYSIAERFAGPDQRAIVDLADRIVDLNLGRTMPDGQVFSNAAFIDVGWVLELPDDSSTGSSGGDPGEATSGSGHTVVPGDSLWSIADEHLGAGRRWTEIFAANRDRTFPDGREFDDPHLIVPGWHLDVPAVDSDATPAFDAAAPADVPSVPSVPVELPVELPAELPAVPADSIVPVDAGDPVDGTDVVVDDGVPVSTLQPAPEVTSTVTPPATSMVEPDDEVDTKQRNRWLDDPGQPAVELLTVGRAAMLSAGVLALLASRRRRRLRESGPDASPFHPSQAEIDLERRLRAVDAGDPTVRLDLAVRSAAPGLVAVGARVVAVLVDPAGALELVASAPVHLSPPWRGGVSPTEWHLDTSVPTADLEPTGRHVGSPCPTLVQIAVTDDGRDLYVDLEAVGTLEVDAPGRVASAVVAAIAAAVAASPSAETAALVDVGVGDDPFLGHRHHRSVADLNAALEEVGSGTELSPGSCRSTFELRSMSSGGEPWEPSLVFVGSHQVDAVPAVRRPGVAIVSACPCVDAGARLVADGTGWRFDPMGVRCVPIGLVPDDARVLATLLRDADAPLADATLPPEVDGDPTATELMADPPAILVRLFGPAVVRSLDGRVAEFDRQKAKELVVWLATHRERSTRTSARTALWELDVRDATFSNVVSDARRTLGRLVPAPDGVEWIGRTLTEDLPLHPAVRTDADLLREALAVARADASEVGTEMLRDAVELIVGMPFEGTDYLWPEAEGIASELLLLATSATTRLAERCLAVGDIDGVFDATARGLQVLPGHEAMVGLRMRAYGSVGDRAGVRREWAQYERVTHADPWSDGEPSASLAGLRRQLLDS